MKKIGAMDSGAPDYGATGGKERAQRPLDLLQMQAALDRITQLVFSGVMTEEQAREALRKLDERPTREETPVDAMPFGGGIDWGQPEPVPAGFWNDDNDVRVQASRIKRRAADKRAVSYTLMPPRWPDANRVQFGLTASQMRAAGYRAMESTEEVLPDYPDDRSYTVQSITWIFITDGTNGTNDNKITVQAPTAPLRSCHRCGANTNSRLDRTYKPTCGTCYREMFERGLLGPDQQLIPTVPDGIKLPSIPPEALEVDKEVGAIVRRARRPKDDEEV